jgi:uncharacterized membrane protein YfcA
MTAARERRRSIVAATGASGGFFSGLTGVGGGAIMIPLMTGALKMRQHTAHGTSLFIIIATALAAAITYQVRTGVNWALVATLLPSSIAGAYAGARLVQYLPAMRLRQVFGVFLLLVGVRMLAFREVASVFDASGAVEAGIGAGIGLAGGIVAGALGVGGGAIFVPALVLLMGVSQHEAQGVSLWVIVVAAGIGAWTHARHGSVDREAVLAITPVAVPSAMLGALVASWLDGDILQRIFGVVVVVVGLQMMLTATRTLRREARMTAKRKAAA